MSTHRCAFCRRRTSETVFRGVSQQGVGARGQAIARKACVCIACARILGKAAAEADEAETKRTARRVVPARPTLEQDLLASLTVAGSMKQQITERG